MNIKPEAVFHQVSGLGGVIIANQLVHDRPAMKTRYHVKHRGGNYARNGFDPGERNVENQFSSHSKYDGSSAMESFSSESKKVSIKTFITYDAGPVWRPLLMLNKETIRHDAERSEAYNIEHGWGTEPNSHGSSDSGLCLEWVKTIRSAPGLIVGAGNQGDHLEEKYSTRKR